jgi:hypothetical protein
MDVSSPRPTECSVMCASRVEPVWRWGRVEAGVETFHHAVDATATGVPYECLDRAAGA